MSGWKCPSCGLMNFAGEDACKRCGALPTAEPMLGQGPAGPVIPAPPLILFCYACHSTGAVGDTACRKCGAPVYPVTPVFVVSAPQPRRPLIFIDVVLAILFANFLLWFLGLLFPRL